MNIFLGCGGLSIEFAIFVIMVWYVYHRFKRSRPIASQDTFRRKLIKRYGHRCMICRYRKAVHAHHIKPKSEKGSNNPFVNGILLCPNCHAEAHQGIISRRKLHKYRRKAARRRLFKFW